MTDFLGMMKKAKELQSKMQDMQAEVATIEVEGASGAIKAIQTPAWKECQDDLLRHAEREGIPRDTPWNQLSEAHKNWVMPVRRRRIRPWGQPPG